jgi:hypothetical protein
MITLVDDFRQQILYVRRTLLLGRQRMEQRLLLAAVSGYASVYKMNRYFQPGSEKCGRLAHGARQ